MNNTNNKIILIGGFHEVIELCELEGISITGIIDSDRQGSYMGYDILGTDSDAGELFKVYGNIPLLVCLDQPELRMRVVERYQKTGFKFSNLFSSNAILSKSARFGTGVFIQRFVNVSLNATIGDFVRLNTMANVMHDCTIGNYTTIAPNAVLLGNVSIGAQTYIGSNSTILPGISIGNKVKIGAGAVVTRDVEDGKTMVGNPAREIISSKL